MKPYFDDCDCNSFETKVFVNNSNKYVSDYTKWQSEYFTRYSLEELNLIAIDFNNAHPFKEKKV